MLSFLVMCYSLTSAFYTAVSQERVSNCPQCTASQDGEVPVQRILQRRTKQAAKKESAHKRPNTPSELARRGDVGQKAPLPAILHLRALRRTGEESKAAQFIYYSLFNTSVLFCLTQPPPCGWNFSIKTWEIWMRFNNIILFIILLIIIIQKMCIAYILKMCIPSAFLLKIIFFLSFYKVPEHFHMPPLSPLPRQCSRSQIFVGQPRPEAPLPHAPGRAGDLRSLPVCS